MSFAGQLRPGATKPSAVGSFFEDFFIWLSLGVELEQGLPRNQLRSWLASSDLPFTPKAVFSAAVSQQTVRRRAQTYDGHTSSKNEQSLLRAWPARRLAVVHRAGLRP